MMFSKSMDSGKGAMAWGRGLILRLTLVVFAFVAIALCDAQTYTLTVYSQNPDSGINVTATPADLNGQTGGATSFSLQYASGTAVTLQAPAAQNGTPFAYWALDSNPHVFATSLQIQMTAAHTATAVYAQPFSITPQTTQGGLITPSTVQTVPSTGSVVFTESPNSAYILQSWQVDGDTLFANTNTTLPDGTTVNVSATTLTFGNVLGNHSVGATFVQTFTITPQTTQNGTLNPNTAQVVSKGNGLTITETPNSGYLLQSWQVDGANVPASTALTDGTTVTLSGTTLVLGNISGSHTVGATFVQSFTITPQTTQNGTLSPSTAQTVAQGASVSFTEAPSNGFILQAWFVDGSAVPSTTTLSDGTTVTISGTTLVFGKVAGSHTVGASFTQTFTITPQATQNGTLSPSTVQTVTQGGSVTFTETPSNGYVLQTWLVDGSAVPSTTTLSDGTTVTISGTTLVFGKVAGSHTVGASFSQTFTITPQATQNGTLSPSTVQTVTQGGSVTFTETPSNGYVLQTWLVDGVSIPSTTTLSDGTTVTISGTTLVFGKVAGSHTVGATFSQTFTITPQVTQNGTLSPSTVQTVTQGGSVTFTEAPSNGYLLQTWQVDGVSIPATTTLSDGTTVTISGTTLVFGKVAGSHTVGATFSQTFTITPQVTQNGTLSPSTVQTVSQGGSVTITETPSTGYMLQVWQVDGANVTATTTLADGTTVTVSGTTLVFGGIKGSHTVGATFSLQALTISPQPTQNGSLSPNTMQTVAPGGSASFTEAPAAGFALLSWQVDGSNVPATTTLADGTTVTTSGSMLTFGNVKGNHTVGAAFSMAFSVTPQTTQNGSLSPNSVQTVASGGTVWITETPNSGYTLLAWLVDGSDVSNNSTLSDGTTVSISGSTISLGNVRGNHTVSATFSLQTLVITPQTTQNGSLSPNTVQTVTLGGTVTFGDTPASGYVLLSWQVDGANVAATTTLSDGTSVTITGTTLVFGNLKGSHTVGATFTQIVPQPADKIGSNSIGINSLTAYGSAWRKGASWPVGPNPIPQNFVTNAAAIWRSGEAYTYNPALAQPTCWAPLYSMEGNVVKAIQGAAVASIAKSSAPNSFVVAINIQAPAATKAYTAEEIVPTGATITNVSDGGVFNLSDRTIRWGPFLDNKTRTLTYTVSTVNSHMAPLSGAASFNGSSVVITGARKLAVKGRTPSLTGGHPF